MDPNATLKDMRELANLIVTGEASDPVAAMDELAELVLALDGWIVQGGFLPSRWAVRPRER